MATITADARSHQGPGHPATPSREERLDTAHNLLMTGLADLTTSDAWTQMLTIATRFHTYSSGATSYSSSPNDPTPPGSPDSALGTRSAERSTRARNTHHHPTHR